jgi:hypothetical protein
VKRRLGRMSWLLGEEETRKDELVAGLSCCIENLGWGGGGG